jgi:tRNA (guanine10-N2)-dimethyltransferase
LLQLFFLLSGEHDTLPSAELKACLEAEDIPFEETQKLRQVLRLHASLKAVLVVKKKTALTRMCCQELFCCSAVFTEIVKMVQQAPLEEMIRRGENFAVRVRRVAAAASSHLRTMGLERKLGELILHRINGVTVQLSQPEKEFIGVITEDTFVFGIKLAEVSPTPFMDRRPRKRPFFHPSSIPAKLARCMVNLAKPRRKGMVVDPFCGTGSFLIEAGLLGCRVLGIDAQRKMAEGSVTNLDFFKVDYEGVIVADANHLPISQIDRIVTDPPYGRSATTLGLTTREVVYKFLSAMQSSLAEGARICIASPKTVNMGQMARSLGFKHVQSHFLYIHRSLTREIAVLEK